MAPTGRPTLRMRWPARPAAVTWMPEGRRLEWTRAGGELVVTVGELEIHGAAVIE